MTELLVRAGSSPTSTRAATLSGSKTEHLGCLAESHLPRWVDPAAPLHIYQ
ncbi:MAG TPA: hypothetical protein VLX59_19965 [Acidimicrobiales bacterium]|nr:hypothetical protein [Acidimicrobiales bacterium]